MVHVLQATQNLVISRDCCFAEDGKEMYQCTQPLFSLLNLSFSDVVVAIAVTIEAFLSTLMILILEFNSQELLK